MSTDETKEAEYFSLEIIAKDRIGLVCEISGAISELNISILHHRSRVYNNRNKGMISDFKVEVKAESYNQLKTLIRRLHKIKGVISVQ